MPISAGKLNTRAVLQRRQDGTDEWGAPKHVWLEVGAFYTNPKNDTGMGAIRSSVGSGVPANIVNYSLEVRSETIRRLDPQPDDRLLIRVPFTARDMILSVTGVILDFADASHAYILAQAGTNES
ncbi:11R [Xanthomonas phage Xp10]|uniref:11R n=1 Tax=Xanthomonas phage Xp10 TaxID=2907956 RepID=Q7Y5K6_9CAUD|nr:conserved phage protein; annotated as head-tail joining in some phages [Xanthomonas phage Xp10]AAP58678.1 11R [Xanthomonas phage Xp10]